MKRFLTIAALCLAMATASAQTNLQTLYDFGRKHFTTTLEGFHTDGGGNTFFFIDIDYNNRIDGRVISPSGAYMEIARCINFWQDTPLSAFSLQVEYNGGLGYGFGINSAFLAGVDVFLHSADYRTTINLKALYKHIVNTPCKVPAQFTAVWGFRELFGMKPVTLSGFVDVWNEGDRAIVLSEPQLWVAFGEHFNVGGEVELGYNFGGASGFTCYPCLGFKWVF